MRETTRRQRDWRHALLADARLALIIILLVAASASWMFLVLTGNDPRQYPFQRQPVNTVQVRLGPDQPDVVVAPFQKTITDAGEAQALYNAAFALPIMPAQVNCPLGPMAVYRLAFSWNGWPALVDMLSLDGCETVNIGGMSVRWASESYMEQFAYALNMPTDAIEDPPTHQILPPGGSLPPGAVLAAALVVPLVVWRRGLVL